MMNRCSALLLLLAGVLGALPASAAFINGRSYTELADWASANGFRQQARRGTAVAYTNRAQTRIVLAKDSTVAQINGVNVALSLPVALDRGRFLVSQLDLAKTINPLLFPAVARERITTICLDPGHGGKDPGNRSGARYEKTYALLLAGELRDQLKRAGFNVILTRTTDKFLELPDRPDIANRKNADLFISLHFNGTASSQSAVSGVETYCITPVGASSSNSGGRGATSQPATANHAERQSLLLAYQVHRSLVRTLGAGDRGVRRARFAVLRDAEMPAILVEGGYLTHPREADKIADPAYRRQIAAAIVKGVIGYQKIAGTTVPNAAAATGKSSRGK